jgi:flagellar hook-associated protein 2
MSLFNQLGSENSSGIYHSLNDLGLSIDGSMQLSIVDSSKLDTALAGNQADVGKLFDNIMGGFSSLLNQFAAPTTGYLASAATSLNQQLTDTNTQIADMTNRLNARQLDLTNQFATIQNQLVQDSYTQQLLTQFYSSTRTA